MEKKRICILIRELKPGGAEKQSLLLTKALKDKYNVLLVVQFGKVIDEKYARFIEENNIQHVKLRGILFTRWYLLYNILREKKIQIIFSYLTSDNFWSGLVGTLAGVEYLVGGIRNEHMTRHKIYITRQLYKYFLDYIIFNSQSGLQTFLKKGFSPVKCRLISNSIEISRPPIKRKNEKKVSILTVARFVVQKDYLTAIRAFHSLKDMLIDMSIEIEYTIIGFGKMESQIRKWVLDYDLEKHIRIIVNPSKLDKYYVDADIFLSTSLFEGLSNSIIEAMSYSLPVVATDVGDNNILVKNEASGYLVPVKAYREIAMRLHDLVNSYEKRISYGLTGYRFVKANFSLSKFQKNYIDFINSLAKD